MLIRGEVQINTFTFGFTVHGSRGDWKMTISAPVFPATVTTEDETSEPTWYPLLTEMLASSYESACRQRFPGRQIVSAARR